MYNLHNFAVHRAIAPAQYTYLAPEVFSAPALLGATGWWRPPVAGAVFPPNPHLWVGKSWTESKNWINNAGMKAS